MNVELVSNLNEYEELTNNFSSTFYHSPKHLKFLEHILKIKSEYIIAKDKNKIKGVMPIFSKKTKFGTVINSLPFFGSYGGIISDKVEARKSILKFFNEHNTENEVLSSVIISNPFESSNFYEKYYKFNDKIERIVQCINLKNSLEKTLWNSFEQRVRRSVRKAEKNSIEIEYAEPKDKILKNFYEMHVTNISSKKGTVKPEGFFTYVKNSFKVNIDYDILTAIHKSKNIAFLLVFYYKSFTEYYMPAYNFKHSNLQATSFLIWESIKKSLQKNMNYYNFGGTHRKQDSLYKFKKGWATNDYSYNYYIYADLDNLEEVGKDELRNNFKNFYVYNYSKLLK